MHVGSGSINDQPSLLLGSVTQMLIRTKTLEPQQIYRMHEKEKKRLYSKSTDIDIEHETFTPLVFTTTGGMGKEWLRYHS